MWEYRASLITVPDADTLTLLLDTGFSGRQEEAIRLLDVSAPERSDPGGSECTAFTKGWITALSTRRWPILVRTQPNTLLEPSERRSFVRYLGTVVDITNPVRSLNKDLAEYLAQHPEWGSGL